MCSVGDEVRRRIGCQLDVGVFIDIGFGLAYCRAHALLCKQEVSYGRHI